MAKPLIQFTEKGIYCEKAGLYIDPWKPVQRAVITHAHADHARPGMGGYLAHAHSSAILKQRLGEDIKLQTLNYNEPIKVNGVSISLHPSGHIYGAAQICLDYKGERWVISGDYKLEDDGLSQPFEPVACDHFVTESTFGLPVFKWERQEKIISEINHWWRTNQEAGKTSIITVYALGKAQRLLKAIDHNIGKVFVHGAIYNVNQALEKDGAQLPACTRVEPSIHKDDYKGQLIFTTGGSIGTSWMNKFQPYETASVSGWMNIRGIKRRRGSGHGFVMSDHADWPGLLEAVKATGASNIYVTHGYASIFARYLTDQGYNAQEIDTQFVGDELLD